MMFNWTDQDQVGSTLWPDLTESEDHIVPHPMEEGALFPSGGYGKNKMDEVVVTNVQSIGQPSQAKTDHHSYKSESSSSFQNKEELSSSIIEMDSWLDFPNLCIELKDDFADGNNQSSATGLVNDLTDEPNLNSVRGESMQLDCDPEFLGPEDKQNDDFLDCDWANFGDFDDIENLFRKSDSIFGAEMNGDVVGFLSPSKDVNDSTVQSIPIPNLPICKDQTTSDEGCSTFQADDSSKAEVSALQKEKVDMEKVIPRSQPKTDERRKNRPSRNLRNSDSKKPPTESCSIHSSVTTPPQVFQSKGANQQVPFNDTHVSTNQVAFAPLGYPTYCFPGMHYAPHVQTEKNKNRHVLASYQVCPNETKHYKVSNKAAAMTPQAKMEKLRQLQKMQAQVAIEQQQQQYGHRVTGSNPSVSLSSYDNQNLGAMASTIMTDECVLNAPSADLTYGPPASETVYCQLQDAVGKLDMRTRLCIRDSLYRLARSSMERQSASDRSSTNKSNKDEDEASADEESGNHDRSMMLADSEADTNPIDRIVANLLFQRPTTTCPRLGSYELLGST